MALFMTVITKLTARGIYFDLEPIFIELNQRFFANQIDAKLRWGLSMKRAPKFSIRLGSYQPHNRLITIHPCLDQAIVPLICVERILFHEMNHQYWPAKISPTGKRLVHHREFNLFERRYPYLQEADTWIKANLKLFLSGG